MKAAVSAQLLESCCALQWLTVLWGLAEWLVSVCVPSTDLIRASGLPCYHSPNCCQVWKLHCLFKQFLRSSRFGKQDHLPTYWRDAVGNKVNTVTAFHVPVKWNIGTCLGAFQAQPQEVYVADKYAGDCSAASEPEVWFWRVQDFRKSHRKSQKQSKFCILWFKQLQNGNFLSTSYCILWVTALLNSVGK